MACGVDEVADSPVQMQAELPRGRCAAPISTDYWLLATSSVPGYWLLLLSIHPSSFFSLVSCLRRNAKLLNSHAGPPSHCFPLPRIRERGIEGAGRGMRRERSFPYCRRSSVDVPSAKSKTTHSCQMTLASSLVESSAPGAKHEVFPRRGSRLVRRSIAPTLVQSNSVRFASAWTPRKKWPTVLASR
jgi:hypothetical protein